MRADDAAKLLALVADEHPDAWVGVGDSRGDVFWVQLVCPRPLSESVATAIEAMGAERELTTGGHWRGPTAETWAL